MEKGECSYCHHLNKNHFEHQNKKVHIRCNDCDPGMCCSCMYLDEDYCTDKYDNTYHSGV